MLSLFGNVQSRKEVKMAETSQKNWRIRRQARARARIRGELSQYEAYHQEKTHEIKKSN